MSHLKRFEPQHEMALLAKTHGITIAHVLKNICENCSHFEHSVVVCANRCQMFLFDENLCHPNQILSLGNRKKLGPDLVNTVSIQSIRTAIRKFLS